MQSHIHTECILTAKCCSCVYRGAFVIRHGHQKCTQQYTNNDMGDGVMVTMSVCVFYMCIGNYFYN